MCGEDVRNGVRSLDDEAERKKKKKSRWGKMTEGVDGKILIPGMPTILPMNLNQDQQEAYLRKFISPLIIKFFYITKMI